MIQARDPGITRMTARRDHRCYGMGLGIITGYIISPEGLAPFSEDTASQWIHKASYAYTARSLSLLLQRDALADLARQVMAAIAIGIAPLPGAIEVYNHTTGAWEQPRDEGRESLHLALLDDDPLHSVGFDVIDINDNLNYCRSVLELQPQIDRLWSDLEARARA